MSTKLFFLPRPRVVHYTKGDIEHGVLGNISVEIVPGGLIHPEGYKLVIDKSGARISAADEAGVFYARQTLQQIAKQLPASGRCPMLEIEDYPEFKCRGFMLDVSRDRIPKLNDLLKYIDLLASWKINHLELYMEHVFAYKGHEKVWYDASPFTAEDIQLIDAFCRERYIELVPLQNSLGHMLRWLRHDKYRSLAECPEGVHSSWSMSESDPFSLCPTDPASLEFMDSLLTELLPNFSSRLFMACCDETFDIGQGRSREACEKHGKGRVYLDYIRKLNETVHRHGCKMLIAADILNSYPELLSELPPDISVVDWGYGVNYPFEEHGHSFRTAGIPFYFMVSCSNYSSTAGRTYRWHGNIRNAAFAAMKTGAEGLINTEWGDFGHWHGWTLSQPGIAYGAAMSWAPNENENIDLGVVMDEFIFGTASGIGDLIMDLGRVYRHVAGTDDTCALFTQFYFNGRKKGESPLDNFSFDGLAYVRNDLNALEARLKRLPKIEKSVQDEILQALRFTRFAVRCAEAWLSDDKAERLRELSHGTQEQLAKEFSQIIKSALSIRDCGYLSGGRDAALWWLKRFWSNVCGSIPFPF